MYLNRGKRHKELGYQGVQLRHTKNETGRHQAIERQATLR